MDKFLKITGYSITIISAASLILSTFAHAQTAPEFMVTWKANDYAPAVYQGKILPIDGSRIDMALELIDNGKIANLSNSEISWVVNGGELKHGINLKNISFTAEGFKGNQKIDITIKGYGAQELTKTITIPLASPEVVITGGPDLFEALPYFFNIQTPALLKFTWTANDAAATGLVDDQSKLSLDTSSLPAGLTISVGVVAQNIAQPTELASQKINIQK